VETEDSEDSERKQNQEVVQNQYAKIIRPPLASAN